MSSGLAGFSGVATTAIVVFAAFVIGQSVLPFSQAGNAGLNAGIAGIAALVALVASVAGGLLALSGPVSDGL